MFAVIRAGGKQYRVAPGDIIRIETPAAAKNGKLQFSAGDVLAVSSEAGKIGSGDATVSAEVVEQGRGDKIIVFKFKRKKQYKKTIGHRQNFSAVRITEIDFDGQKFSAPELPAKKSKPAKEAPTAEAAAANVSTATEKTAKKRTPAKKTTAAKKKSSKK
jgi:large subunit ribosomal protein L21